MTRLDTDHLDGSFATAIMRAHMLMNFGKTPGETARILAVDVDREMAFLAVNAAKVEQAVPLDSVIARMKEQKDV